MENIPTKVDGETVSASIFNQQVDELENVITSSGITLSNADLTQLAKAIANYAGQINYCLDTGAANAYVCNVQGTFKASTALTAGLTIRFRAANANSGASTINYASLGVKNIKKADGSSNLVAGDITTTQDTEVIYDGTNFRLKSFGTLEIGKFNPTDISVSGKLSFSASATTTISGGAIAYIATNMVIDTEGLAATDNLDTITGGVDGDILILSCASNSRAITIRHLIDNITTQSLSNITLTNIIDRVVLTKDNNYWVPTSQATMKDYLSNKITNGGYYYLPNGLLLQWGISDLLGNGAYSTITLPITYSTACLTAQVSGYSGGSDSGDDILPTIMSYSTSTLRICMNIPVGAYRALWQTLGY